MVVNYDIDMDLANPGETCRIHMKQGDVMSRCIYINLLENGDAWRVSAGTAAVIRYCAQDPDGLVTSHGLYDTLEDGSAAYMLVGNVLSVTPLAEMTAKPGLVQVDVLLVDGAKMLATFNFEIYVHRSPNTGTQAQAGNYYRVASLDAINSELDKLRTAVTALGGGSYLN